MACLLICDAFDSLSGCFEYCENLPLLDEGSQNNVPLKWGSHSSHFWGHFVSWSTPTIFMPKCFTDDKIISVKGKYLTEIRNYSVSAQSSSIKCNGLTSNETKTVTLLFSLRSKGTMKIAPSTRFLGLHKDVNRTWGVHVEFASKNFVVWLFYSEH